MDEVHFSCELCGKSLSAPLTSVGRRFVCPECNGLTVVPEPQAAPPPTEELRLAPPPTSDAADAATGALPDAAGPVVAITRVCGNCGASMDLGPEHVGKDVQCPACYTAVPPGPNEVLESMEYPDRPNVKAQAAGWLTSLAVHTVLFMCMAGVTLLPSMGTSMDKGPVGLVEDPGGPAVEMSEPEPVEVAQGAEAPDLAPKPDKIEPLADPALDAQAQVDQVKIAAEPGVGASKPQAIASLGGAVGGMKVGRGKTVTGGSASNFKGLMKNRKGPGKGRALAKFGGRDTVKSVKKGLKWLAAQQASNGGWGNCAGVSGLALLAFLGDGHTTKDGKYRKTVARGCDFLRQQGRRNGDRVVYAGRMYEQGIAAFALAEEYAMSKSSSTRDLAKGALMEVLRSQYSDGGWRYQHGGGARGDTSVTGWQIMALKAGKDAGLCHPSSAFAQATKFLNKVKSEQSNTAGFGYTSPGATWNMSGVGLVSLQFMRSRNTKLMHKAARGLMQSPPKADQRPPALYGLYYATIGMFQMGGKYWKQWNHPMKKSLMKSQEADGHWDKRLDGHSPNAIYTTALAVLTLEVYYRYTPLGIK